MPERRAGVKLRRFVGERARGRCEYCLTPARVATQNFSVEHILPWSQGGLTQLANLALACQGCNGYKLDRTTAPDPRTGAEVPLFHPRTMAWHDHFAWCSDGMRMIGLTQTGRATVALLRLNRPGLVAMRELLIAAGQHPPKEGSVSRSPIRRAHSILRARRFYSQVISVSFGDEVTLNVPANAMIENPFKPEKNSLYPGCHFANDLWPERHKRSEESSGRSWASMTPLRSNGGADGCPG